MKAAIKHILLHSGGGLRAPDAPTLVAPADGAVTSDTTPDFSWNAVTGATSYDIEIRTTLTGTPTATGIAVTTYTPAALTNFTTFSWRVRAVNAGGVAGAWSETRTVVIASYLLYDAFATPVAAGAVNGTTADGTGQVRTVNDPQSRASVTLENGLEIGTSGVAGVVDVRYPEIARASGLAVCTRIMRVAGGAFLYASGRDNDLTSYMNNSIQLSTVFEVRPNGSAIVVAPGAPGANGTATYDELIIWRGTAGSWLYIRGGSFTTWTLLYIDNLNAINGYPGISMIDAATTNSMQMRRIASAVIPALSDSWAGVSARKAVSINGDTLTAPAGDALIEHTVTYATGVTQELKFRYTDDDNCILLRLDQAAATAKIIKREGGAETELSTVGSVTQTNGTAQRWTVRLSGTSILAVQHSTFTRADITNAYNATVTGVKVTRAGTDLAAWPLTPGSEVLAQLNAFFPVS